MSELAVEASPVEPAQGRGHRLLKVGAALVAVVVVVAFLHVAGVDVGRVVLRRLGSDQGSAVPHDRSRA